MSMQGLRNAANNINNKNSGKGSSRVAFYARWKPPQISAGAGMGKQRTTFDLRPFLAAPPSEESKIEAAEPVVFIKGEYDDPFAVDSNGARLVPPPKIEGLHFRHHTFNVYMAPRNPQERGYNTFRDIVCSAGPEPHAPQPCLGCYDYDHGKKESKPKDQWVFNIAHLGWYHLLPLVKDGQVQMKKDGSGPVMIKQECTTHKMESILLGRAINSGRVPGEIAKRHKPCEGCQQQAQFAWGDHRIIQFGWKHLKNVLEIDDKVGKKCLNCGTGILRVAFDCEKCQTEIVDLSQVQWTNDQIETFSKTPFNCTSCGHGGLPQSAYDCGYDDNYNQVAASCGNPQKTTLFDCVLWLQREGESTESEVVVKRVELLSQYRTQDNRALSEHLKEIVRAPFDLAEMFKPDSLDDQANTTKLQNPYAQQQQQFSSYGGAGPAGNYPTPGGYQQQPNYGPQNGPGPGPGPGGPPPGMPMPGRPNFGK